MEELFPGLYSELVEDGAVRTDFLTDVIFQYLGHRLYPAVTRHAAVLASRPFIEAHLRRRVLNVSNVHLCDDHEVTDIVMNMERNRASGVKIRSSDRLEENVLAADLVVDALGRTGRGLAWLKRIGYPVPYTQRLSVPVRYASRLFHIEHTISKEFPAKMMVLGPQPNNRRALIFFAQENDSWILSLAGYDRFTPPRTHDQFLDAVRETSPTEIYPLIRAAEPIGKISTYSFPGGHRMRYERLRRHPRGLISLGDSICCLNPLYGTGITVAAESAILLRDCLARASGEDFTHRFYNGAAQITRPPWLMTKISDRVLNHQSAWRDPIAGLGSMLIRRVARTAERNPTVAVALIESIAMINPPAKLLHPRIIGQLLRP